MNEREPSPEGIGRDPDAFEAFYRCHVRAVQRFVARRVGDPEVVADLTADIFVALIGAAPRYRSDAGAPEAWLYGIAHKVVNAHRRRTARELAAVRRIAGRRLLDADSLERVRERVDAERAARLLQPALDRLVDAERSVFELVVLDGLSVGDAAVALGVKPVTARVRLHRARRSIALFRGTANDPVAAPGLADTITEVPL